MARLMICAAGGKLVRYITTLLEKKKRKEFHRTM